jgi:hypothetical protein
MKTLYRVGEAAGFILFWLLSLPIIMFLWSSFVLYGAWQALRTDPCPPRSTKLPEKIEGTPCLDTRANSFD